MRRTFLREWNSKGAGFSQTEWGPFGGLAPGAMSRRGHGFLGPPCETGFTPLIVCWTGRPGNGTSLQQTAAPEENGSLPRVRFRKVTRCCRGNFQVRGAWPAPIRGVRSILVMRYAGFPGPAYLTPHLFSRADSAKQLHFVCAVRAASICGLLARMNTASYRITP